METRYRHTVYHHTVYRHTVYHHIDYYFGYYIDYSIGPCNPYNFDHKRYYY